MLIFFLYSNELNAGSMLIRSSMRSIDFLERAARLFDATLRNKGEDISEQDAIRDLIATDHWMSARTHFIPQNTINAYPEEIECNEEDGSPWQYGDFVMHFAGAWVYLEMEDPIGFLMNKYEGDIIWGDYVPSDRF